MKIFIESTNFNGFATFFARKQMQIHSNIGKALNKVGFMVAGDAKINAPRLNGDLERNITHEVHDDYVKIFVPINSPAGKYAAKREYEDYELGPVSQAKSRAGNHFIQRSIDKNKDNIKASFRNIL